MGPHTLHYLDGDGAERDIEITIDLLGDAPVVLSDGLVFPQRAGVANVASEFYNHSFRLEGNNDLQLIVRLLRIAGIDLLRIAREGDFEIFQFEELEVKDEYDLFF